MSAMFPPRYLKVPALMSQTNISAQKYSNCSDNNGNWVLTLSNKAKLLSMGPMGLLPGVPRRSPILPIIEVASSAIIKVGEFESAKGITPAFFPPPMSAITQDDPW
jgi:hypothetical protein